MVGDVGGKAASYGDLQGFLYAPCQAVSLIADVGGVDSAEGSRRQAEAGQLFFAGKGTGSIHQAGGNTKSPVFHGFSCHGDHRIHL